MGRRFKVIINYNYDENWIGGTYYVENLIHALNLLSDEEQPALYIKSNNINATEILFKKTAYKYLTVHTTYSNLSKIKRALNKFCKQIFQRNIFSPFEQYDLEFPGLFSEKENFKNKLFWIPDFQEKHLPNFFTPEDISYRDSIYTTIQNCAYAVVFSSEDAKKDFNLFYPHAKPKQFVLNFSTHHQIDILPQKDIVLSKYRIKNDYFLCSNQFWTHKNHIVILNAIKELKDKNIDITVVFTGKESDYRNPDYFKNLQSAVVDLDIASNVKFLGFISREDQIVLLQNCLAIIQPSLFEGWSTVHEDAKAENVFILASDINVNLEQLKHYPNKRFFDPHNPADLCTKIQLGNFSKTSFNYLDSQLSFGKNFTDIIKKIIR
ncbi:glycosyltransferase [Chryseobacterium caseinilyticum]|uniref:Glycosyltransferase n=1 Tax=Chryseobacterium caseinilyticum TaxID=2771428 RepID=A0ABR8ZG71_9FLAO|nr:glycosyltransferase [Chryseobacterium caseinilyticum]MBD8084301.1 glycosyltransferase [Chryseobacterium caseinilyticum]